MMSFLTFRLGKEQFAVKTACILEIIEVPKITTVPRSPDYLLGVFNLRGSVSPVIDTRIKFKMDHAEITINSCIVVMEIEVEDETIIVGSLVDGVNEVVEINESEIKPSPTIGSNYNADFIEGVISINNEFIMILNIGKVFSMEEANYLAETSTEENIDPT